jgi:hypothetical protein
MKIEALAKSKTEVNSKGNNKTTAVKKNKRATMEIRIFFGFFSEISSSFFVF